MLVRRVVVQNQVNVRLRRSFLVNHLDETQPLLVAVPGCPLGNDLAIEVIQSGKEGQRPVPVIVVGAGLNVPLSQRQTGLRAFQRLALALFIAAEYHRPNRWIQLKADDIPELGLEVLVIGEFEGASAVRLEIIGRPEPLHGILGESQVARHAPAGPPLASVRRLDHLGQHASSFSGIQSAGAAWSWSLLQAGQTQIHEPLPPQTYGRRAGGQLSGDLVVVESLGGQQDDTSFRLNLPSSPPPSAA